VRGPGGGGNMGEARGGGQSGRGQTRGSHMPVKCT
jgi:hypothetical protein